jgi:hypothetical protein
LERELQTLIQKELNFHTQLSAFYDALMNAENLETLKRASALVQNLYSSIGGEDVEATTAQISENNQQAFNMDRVINKDVAPTVEKQVHENAEKEMARLVRDDMNRQDRVVHQQVAMNTQNINYMGNHNMRQEVVGGPPVQYAQQPPPNMQYIQQQPYMQAYPQQQYHPQPNMAYVQQQPPTGMPYVQSMPTVQQQRFSQQPTPSDFFAPQTQTSTPTLVDMSSESSAPVTDEHQGRIRAGSMRRPSVQQNR